MSNREVCRAILDKLISGEFADDQDLTRVKLWACREFGLKNFPRNSEILAVATDDEREEVLSLLRLKPIRSISGVSVITVMPKPFPCPKDDPCVYCPGGPCFGTPQSYTGSEPAGRRAFENDFDPYKQVKSRIEQFKIMGHAVDKVELIIFGGTITAYPVDYLEWFVTQCLNAMSGADAKTIEQAQVAAENASIRNSDITIETRPDCFKESHVDFMLRLGATRVELGVQSVYDDVYKLVNRGHTVKDVVEATRIAKDSGFAVIYHMMPGLIGSNFDRDLKAFETIFCDDRFKPDAIKIYPTLVMPGTKLYNMWKQGDYKPYSLDEIIELIIQIKKRVPRWVRIQRIQRDIPANKIAEGVKLGDLRLLVQKQMKKKKVHCKCIRCREVGHVQYKSKRISNKTDVKLVVDRYKASEGEEIFLSFEDVKQDVLIGLLRLRYPSEKAHRLEVKNKRSMLVRELHVYGPLVQVGSDAEKNEWQHRGWGERLMQEGERISKEEFNANKIIVLAGIGTRNYYRRLGYEREGPYMVKNI
ncbi:MAG: tRNA uridine(34) 5-carboxymethylaminomethyl modification radical SAM/GNAT enzyme Elp3 [Candidatus Thermoplasmatota archaeon]|jgi:elongator complex protein 3|nr:tRNA uridine(34) 5-carboxymethylaminomethyl modification radical SAM/GNAT enzyme Elp3 [Candidatus Thermoplasmatota archaeon]